MTKSSEALPDTNYILRYLLRDIPEQFSVVDPFFELVRVGRERAVILEGVLVECIYILTKKYLVPRSDAAATLTGLLQYKGVTNQDKDMLVDALNRYSTTKLDPVDCILLARAVAGSLRIFSFDKALCKAFAIDKKP